MPSLIFLGTGTSTGIPMINCSCYVCSSEDPHDYRLRSSAIYKDGDKNILIDCGPDFHVQFLKYARNIHKLDGVLLTHEHNDHCIGLDELRGFTNTKAQEVVEIYGIESVLKFIRSKFDYCFPDPEKQKYLFSPSLATHTVEEYKTFEISGIPIKPLTVMHGKLKITGYKIGEKLGYITDCSSMPEKTKKELLNLDILVINALCHTTFYSHQSFEDALEIIKEIKPKKVYFVHMNHSAGTHVEMEKWAQSINLEGTQLIIPYDGITVEF